MKLYPKGTQMKYTILETTTCKAKTADYSKRHGVEAFTGETYTLSLVKFDEVQTGKIQFALFYDEDYKNLDTMDSFEGLGNRTEASARKDLKTRTNRTFKLERW